MMAWPETCPSGALPAYVDTPAGVEMHETSFFTALGCLALEAWPDASQGTHRMLEFLELCEAPNRPGAFAFWPVENRPHWARGIPPDADDTALCLSLLYRAGRRSRTDAIRQAATVLLPHRQPPDPFAPRWIATGAFRTWLASDRDRPNAVDCAVNANVLALFAALDMRAVPGTKAALRTIVDGVTWAGRDPARLHALTPFYPEPRELVLALERAANAGVTELRAPLAALRRFITGLPGPNAVLCAGAYLNHGWRSPALHTLRTARTPSIHSQHETCAS